jgi:hypothetical protein
MSNPVFVRDLPSKPGHKGVLVNTLAIPEPGPNGLNIVVVGVIAVADSWEILPIGNVVLLRENELDDHMDVLAARYPQREAPQQKRTTLIVPVAAPPGLG